MEGMRYCSQLAEAMSVDLCVAFTQQLLPPLLY